MASKVIKKEQCPICAKEGRDFSENNLAVYDDGHTFCYAGHGLISNNKQEEFMSEEYTYEYIPHRGLNKNTLKFYDIKAKINAEGKPISVGFPYSNGAYKVRSLADKNFYSTGEISKAGLFGWERFSSGSHKHVTITEGEYDAASLYQVLSSPVCSVQSAAVAVRDCTHCHEWLSGYERIYLCFDNDEAGRKAAREVARLFDPSRVYHVKLTKYKDANDYLQHGEEEELRQVWLNAKKYLPEGIVSSPREFAQILRERPRKGLPLYPSALLNEMTYGVRTGESVLITAQEGVGKTELMHAIEFKALKETDYAVGAIFLEEPKGRHLQALAGLELQAPVHLPDCGCSDGEISSALERLVPTDDRLYLYSHFGSDDPDVITDTIRYLVSACNCRLILLDHITMVVSGLAGEDERKALDYLSTKLEMMVKELDFALIMVSHVNDEGLTRGSRYISKVADIRINAKRDLTSADLIKRNTTYLDISKNRFSGLTGPAGILLFDPVTYSYKDVEAANDNSIQISKNAA